LVAQSLRHAACTTAVSTAVESAAPA